MTSERRPIVFALVGALIMILSANCAIVPWKWTEACERGSQSGCDSILAACAGGVAIGEGPHQQSAAEMCWESARAFAKRKDCKNASASATYLCSMSDTYVHCENGAGPAMACLLEAGDFAGAASAIKGWCAANSGPYSGHTCAQYGDLYLAGTDGFPRDAPLAVALFRSGCEDDDASRPGVIASNCAKASAVYQDGAVGVPPDAALAQKYASLFSEANAQIGSDQEARSEDDEQQEAQEDAQRAQMDQNLDRVSAESQAATPRSLSGAPADTPTPAAPRAPTPTPESPASAADSPKTPAIQETTLWGNGDTGPYVYGEPYAIDLAKTGCEVDLRAKCAGGAYKDGKVFYDTNPFCSNKGSPPQFHCIIACRTICRR
jgi:hypothetical protein